MSRYHQSYSKAPTQSYNRNTSQNQYGVRRQPQNSMSSEELQLLRRTFAIFDLDDSKKIAKDEFRSALRCLGYTASDEEIDALISRYDADGDGLMNESEFLSMVKTLNDKGYQYGKKAFKKEIEKAFSVLDADGDGYLSPAELKYVLCNTGNKMSREEVEDFFQIFDKDKDGRISCDELVRLMCCSLEDHINALLQDVM